MNASRSISLRFDPLAVDLRLRNTTKRPIGVVCLRCSTGDHSKHKTIHCDTLIGAYPNDHLCDCRVGLPPHPNR